MKLSIRTQRLWEYARDQVAYFHPRPCVMPGASTAVPRLFMTLQPVTGSDYFHHVQWTASNDNGMSWSPPLDVPGLGWQDLGDGISEGVCDVVPGYHAASDTLLACGHSVYYRDQHLLDTLGNWGQENVGFRRRIPRFPVYMVRTSDCCWSPRRKLECALFADSAIYTSGCSQRIDLEDGDILFAISHTDWKKQARAVCSLRCSFDGNLLTVRERGPDVELPVKRGLIEPSLARCGNRFLMTIRAEDDHGYVVSSADGLNWSALHPWCWEDGEALVMSTNQQHWLEHRGRLYLVYNRRAAENRGVFRWRSPLYIARYDPERHCLLRASEQIVFPLRGDGTMEPARVPGMANFHTCAVTSGLSIITVGEECSYNNWHGDTLIAWIE